MEDSFLPSLFFIAPQYLNYVAEKTTLNNLRNKDRNFESNEYHVFYRNTDIVSGARSCDKRKADFIKRETYLAQKIYL
jgi:hypothetical protein